MTTLTTTPHRDATPRTPAALEVLIRAAERRIAALRDAGLPTGHAEGQLRKLEQEARS
jgi:hypothetical protein